VKGVLKVSVIVPVYNPGHNIDDCIGSLLGQSLPPDEYEVIFVDDGSSDGTEARLDALAAEHEHVRVEHIPNSGWPGKPRNIGIEMARGEYVYFVDNDDWIGKDALKRLYGRAERDEADIVIGRVVGEGKFVARTIFKRDRKDVTLAWPPLLRLLTPHKLFRKSMLDEYAIRFPEGRRRLEDHVFTMHAYFHARSISVLARYPCYHWALRDDGENASTGEFDAAGYYGNVREVLDLIDEHMEPGPLRERVRSHWYRGKMLGRVGGRGFVKRRPEFRRRLYEEIHALALERYTEDVHEWLSFSLTLRSMLLRAGHYEALEALSRWESTLQADVTVVEARARDGGVRVKVEARMRDEHGPMAFEKRGERYVWVPPAALDGEFPPEALDATDALEASNVDLLISHVSGGPEYVVPTEREIGLEPIEGRPDHVAAVVRGEAFVDPERSAAETKLRRGEWDVGAAMWTTGFAAPRTEVLRRGEPLRLLVTHGGRLVPPGWRRELLERLPAVVRAVGRVRARLTPGRQAGSAGAARSPAATGEPEAPNSMSTTRSEARPSSSSQKVDTKS
jgi:glycosyltransferase involved in cell wall biosynthesis